jgi:pentatricopeptide repeat protein
MSWKRTTNIVSAASAIKVFEEMPQKPKTIDIKDYPKLHLKIPEIIQLNLLQINSQIHKSKKYKMVKKQVLSDNLLKIYNNSLKKLFNLRKPDVSEEYFRLLKMEKKIAPSQETFEIMSRGYLLNGKMEESLHFFNLIESPTVQMYEWLISGLCKCNQLEKALEIFEQHQDLKLSSIVYFQLISSLISRGNYKSAVKMNQLLEQRNKETYLEFFFIKKSKKGVGKLKKVSLPSKKVMNSIFRKKSFKSDFFDRIEKISRNDENITKTDYLNLIFGFVILKKFSFADKLFEKAITKFEMKKHIFPFFFQLCKQFHIKYSEKYFKLVNSFKFNTQTVDDFQHEMIKVYCKKKRINEALDLFNYKNDSRNNHKIILPCLLRKDVKKGIEFFEKLQNKNIKVYEILIVKLAEKRLMKEAVFYFEELISKKMNPTIAMYRALVAGFSALGMASESIFYFEKLQLETLEK